MDGFKQFIIKLATQLATGDFVVYVECEGEKIFSADVVGYNEEYMTVKVRFHLDDLTKPGMKRVPKFGFGFGTVDEDEYELIPTQVPVKEENVYYTHILFKNQIEQL